MVGFFWQKDYWIVLTAVATGCHCYILFGSLKFANSFSPSPKIGTFLVRNGGTNCLSHPDGLKGSRLSLDILATLYKAQPSGKGGQGNTYLSTAGEKAAW